MKLFITSINVNKRKPCIYLILADENRDVNMPSEDDIKRQRIAYSGDQIYSNASVIKTMSIVIVNNMFFFSEFNLCYGKTDLVWEMVHQG